MTLKNILYASLLGMGLLFIVSCDKDDDTDDPIDMTCEETTYNDDVKTIIDMSCNVTGCHDGSSYAPGLRNFDEANTISDRIIARAITEKDMPPSGPLSDEILEILQCWVDNGKQEG